MTARILRFTGAWQGRIEPREPEDQADAIALHDARQIIAAKREADNWMSVVLLGMLASMDKPYLLRAELAIGTHAKTGPAMAQALALVRLGSCGKEHRARVMAALNVLQERG